ncbi:hypothetical protein N9L06_01635 [Mariniblastus sp.]|nr:hypothetical protein [Mariniblastus sp.]
MDWLHKITVTCFAASYAVALVLELSRVFFQSKFRQPVRLGFMVAGLFAHFVYLVIQNRLEFNANGIWMGSWFSWCLAAAWLLAAAYVWISFRQSQSVIGLFLLPLVLLLIFVAYQFDHEGRFTIHHARSVWNMIHGSSLLLGTTVVVLGFVFGVVYLVQARRLKTRSIPSKFFRLPSLEWLQANCERSLVISAMLLGVGLISGIMINLINNPLDENGLPNGTIAWSSPVIWSSSILFGWMLVSLIANLFYRPTRQGRKVAYIVVTCALFLTLELGIVWWSGHATSDEVSAGSNSTAVIEIAQRSGGSS